MKTGILLGLFIIGVAFSTSAQTYSVPFASKGNVVELEMVDTGDFSVVMVVKSHPEWVSFSNLSFVASSTHPATFEFDLKDKAPIGKPGTLVFDVLKEGNVLATKNISIVSEAPSEFQLSQNYPNPFNPTTTISYQLPEAMEVNIRVFDILGRQVALLVNKQETAGFHEVQLNASALASGMYLYKINAKTVTGTTYTLEKKMMLVK